MNHNAKAHYEASLVEKTESKDRVNFKVMTRCGRGNRRDPILSNAETAPKGGDNRTVLITMRTLAWLLDGGTVWPHLDLARFPGKLQLRDFIRQPFLTATASSSRASTPDTESYPTAHTIPLEIAMSRNHGGAIC